MDIDPSDGARFHRFWAFARGDPAVLAFWLSGSRGKGRGTVHSDYDCAVVVRDEAFAEAQVRYGCFHRDMTDCLVMTWAMFEADGAPGTARAWNRYSYARITALIDVTGQAQRLIDAKGRLGRDEAPEVARTGLDHYLNQTYRALKCRHDGLDPAARLEAADAAFPLLDALFALNGSRLRPYAKYLAWELDLEPLRVPAIAGEALLARLTDLPRAEPDLLRALVRLVEPAFREAGYGEVFDAWGPAMAWMRG